MTDDPEDIFSEQDDIDVDTLANLGPLTALAIGQAAADAREFTVTATRGSTVNGIASAPFLEHAFRTDAFTLTVTVHDDGTWSYEEDTVLQVLGRPEPFHHTDRNRLARVAPPTPNPMAHKAKGG